MLDLTTSRSLEGRGTAVVDASQAPKPLSLRRPMPVWGGRSIISRLSGNAGIVLAVFFAAMIVWISLDLLQYRSDTPKPAVPDAGRQTQNLDAMVEEILDRPLFSSDRRPPPQMPSPQELAALKPPVLKSHLTGITIVASERLALFVSSENKYLSLKEGGDIDGFKVRSIAADQVILASAFGEQIVRPSKGASETVRNTKPVELGSFDPDKH